jgi:hypothetical protein
VSIPCCLPVPRFRFGENGKGVGQGEAIGDPVMDPTKTVRQGGSDLPSTSSRWSQLEELVELLGSSFTPHRTKGQEKHHHREREIFRHQSGPGLCVFKRTFRQALRRQLISDREADGRAYGP